MVRVSAAADAHNALHPNCVVCGGGADLVLVTAELRTQAGGNIITSKLEAILHCSITSSSTHICLHCYSLINMYDYFLNQTSICRDQINKCHINNKLHQEYKTAPCKGSPHYEASETSPDYEYEAPCEAEYEAPVDASSEYEAPVDDEYEALYDGSPDYASPCDDSRLSGESNRDVGESLSRLLCDSSTVIKMEPPEESEQFILPLLNSEEEDCAGSSNRDPTPEPTTQTCLSAQPGVADDTDMDGGFVSVPHSSLSLCSVREKANTRKQRNMYSVMFQQFLAREIGPHFQQLLNPEHLTLIIEATGKFFTSLTNKDGTKMKVNTLNQVKWAVKKYLQPLGIVLDHTTADRIHRNIVKEAVKEGRGAPVHHQSLSEEHLAVMYGVDTWRHALDTDCPVKLQRKVWFDLVFHLCRRGNEKVHDMSTQTFAVSADRDGVPYIHQVHSESVKNHKLVQCDTVGEGRIYSWGDDPRCPVASYHKYISLLHPDLASLWQKPNPNYKPGKPAYVKQKLGEKKIKKMLPSICSDAGIPRFTNHSLRITPITILHVLKLKPLNMHQNFNIYVNA